jgi:hypothetical protein
LRQALARESSEFLRELLRRAVLNIQGHEAPSEVEWWNNRLCSTH